QVRQGPPRPRPPLRDRLLQGRARAGLEAGGRLRGRPARHGRLVQIAPRVGRRHPHRRVSQLLREAVRQPLAAVGSWQLVVGTGGVTDVGGGSPTPRTPQASMPYYQLPTANYQLPAMPRAIITGVTGQDGSYLAEWLLGKGYEVHGIVRRASTENFDRIAHLADKVTLHQADLLDQLSIIEVLQQVKPHEVYNLAAMSFVPTSWKQPVLTSEFTAVGVTRVLEAIRLLDPKGIRFYQASSSEMFGKVQETPQKETTPFYPRSPYGVAKVYGHFITVNYRE